MCLHYGFWHDGDLFLCVNVTIIAIIIANYVVHFDFNILIIRGLTEQISSELEQHISLGNKYVYISPPNQLNYQFCQMGDSLQ